MKPADLPLDIRRILVALDASAGSMAALEGAAHFASRLDAELLGLFVEDEDLLRLAGLPFAEELEFVSARKRPLKAEDMEQRLRAQAMRAEQALSLAAARHRLNWKFRVVRGALARELLAAIEDVDLTVLGGVAGPIVGSGMLSTAALEAILDAEHPVLLLTPGGRIREPIAVLYGTHPLAQQALAIGMRLAKQDGGTLIVLVVADSSTSEALLMRAARDTVAGMGLQPEFRFLRDARAGSVLSAVRTTGIGTLVIPGSLGPDASELARSLVDQQNCAVILVQ